MDLILYPDDSGGCLDITVMYTTAQKFVCFGLKEKSFLYHCFKHSMSLSHKICSSEMPHVHPSKDIVRKHVQVWCYDLFQEDTRDCFVVVKCIILTVIVAVDKVEVEACSFVWFVITVSVNVLHLYEIQYLCLVSTHCTK